jgi:hypothetical protein
MQRTTDNGRRTRRGAPSTGGRIFLLLLLLAVPARAQTYPTILASHERALARYPRNPYFQFAVMQTARRFGLAPPPSRLDVVSRWRPGIYETTTGAAAIQESLQLDRLVGGSDEDGPATLPLAEIQGVDTPSIDFEKLLAGLSKRPVVEPLAHSVPADWYYAHFPDVSDMRRVLDAADAWGGHLLAAYATSGRDVRLRERLENRLLLRSSSEFDSFYGVVVGAIALVGSDPFLVEGSDVTAVFELKNNLLFTARMDLVRRDAAAAASGPSIVHEQYRGWQIDGLANADRSISSYTAVRQGLAAVSTSLVAIKEVVDAAEGAKVAMAALPEFRYMRALFPYANATEDGFLFLSDAFVRRVVSPRLKIGEGRRMRCAVSLQTAAFAAMLFRSEQSAAPASLDELVERKYLDRASLRCPDGGVYALGGGVPVCSIHNRVGAMTPNVEIRMDRVTQSEADGYARYREEYKSYWRRFVDPVGVRARVDEGLRVDAAILPLVENSIYRNLTSLVGGKPVSFARPQLADAIVTLDAKLAPPDEQQGLAWIVGREVGGQVSRALGDWVSFQVLDGKPVVLPDVGWGFAGAATTRGFGDDAMFAPLLTALTLPTVAVAPVRDKAALDAWLARLRADVRDESDGWGPWLEIGGYHLVEGGARPVEAVTVKVLGFRFRMYYATIGDRFVVATDRALVESMGSAPLAEAGSGNLGFEIAPERWSALAPALALSYAEDARAACVGNFGWVEALGTVFGKPPHELDAESLALLGAVFECPDGGRYALDGEGRALCTVHGTKDVQRQGPRPQPGSPAAYVLERVRRAAARLSITAEGITTSVEIR